MADYIQVPPDSTGKKLLAHQHTMNNTDLYVQCTHITGHNDPNNILYVDNRGAAFMRFTDGPPTLDPFANLKMVQSYIMGVYEHSEDSYDDLMNIVTANGASSTYVPEQVSVLLNTTTDANSTVTRTTRRYHYHQPSVGSLIIMTVACGDTGKTHNIRQWGYFDDEDGVFFELNGTTVNAVLRSKTSGTVVDTRIPQANWNMDSLDGTGLSGFTLDPSMFQLYWIDIAWLGAGTVRFGVYTDEGQRVTCHTIRNSGQNPYAYMSRASLPMRWANYNTGVTSGASDLRIGAAVVRTEGAAGYTFWRHADMESNTITVTTNTPVLTVRAKEEIALGVRNRINALPEKVSIIVSGGPVKMMSINDATLDANATWNITGESSVEGDDTATGYTGGTLRTACYFPEGYHNIDVTDLWEINDEGIMQGGLTYAATALTANTTTVRLLLSYRELY